MRVSVELQIEATPERIFAMLTDIPRWAERISAIQRVDLLTDGPVRVGTRFRETRLMFGRQASEEMTVAELAQPSLFVLTAESHGTKYRTEHLLAPAGTGTRLRLIFEGTPVTLGARLFMPIGWMMQATMRRMIEADLQDLKAAAERSR